MSEEDKQFVIKCTCGGIDTIVSIEEVIMRYPAYPNNDGEIEFDSANGKEIFGQIDHLECWKCEAYYSEEDVAELVIKNPEVSV